MSETRAICLNCIDGRAQIPAINWITENLKVDYVDMVTEPGIDGLLADQNYSIEQIKSKINISIEKNNAQVIVVAGHYDCKGNPVDESAHKEQIQKSVARFKEEFDGLDVVGLWINNQFKGEAI